MTSCFVFLSSASSWCIIDYFVGPRILKYFKYLLPIHASISTISTGFTNAIHNDCRGFLFRLIFPFLTLVFDPLISVNENFIYHIWIGGTRANRISLPRWNWYNIVFSSFGSHFLTFGPFGFVLSIEVAYSKLFICPIIPLEIIRWIPVCITNRISWLMPMLKFHV